MIIASFVKARSAAYTPKLLYMYTLGALQGPSRHPSGKSDDSNSASFIRGRPDQSNAFNGSIMSA